MSTYTISPALSFRFGEGFVITYDIVLFRFDSASETIECKSCYTYNTVLFCFDDASEIECKSC